MSTDTKPERDPRFDPLVGDFFRCGNRLREVVTVNKGWVGWSGNAPSGSKRKTTGNYMCIDSWRKWAAGATVISKGKD